MAGSSPMRAGRVFISYRRDDTGFPAAWLYERLANQLGRSQVFKDVDSIELGDDFPEIIANAVGSCDVLLALIGGRWLTVVDEAGRRRLDDPNDFVRLEIEAALERRVRLIPILVEGTRMPPAEQLPASLAALVRRQALELSPTRFESDTSRLLRVLDKALAEKQVLPTRNQPALRGPTYLDFDVIMKRGDKGTYEAIGRNFTAGEAMITGFTPPSELDVKDFLLRIAYRSIRSQGDSMSAIKEFGGQLYSSLFRDQLRSLFQSSISAAHDQGAGLRVRLDVWDVPELAQVPWEFLYDRARNRFLCLSHMTPLVRYVELPESRPLAVELPLRILVILANPSDFGPLELEKEWAALRTALAPLERAEQVVLERLEPATTTALRQRLRRDDWHILHFTGNGGFNEKTHEGVLVFEDESGAGRLVSGEDLGMLLSSHDSLRLVVLNAGETARTDNTDSSTGIAQSLVRQGIPAVVAMQFEITDAAAITFSHELYGTVADGYPIDAALAETRKAIFADGNQVEWACPVLYSSAPDGLIFDLA